MKIGDSSNNKGDLLDAVDFKKYEGFKHALVFFGGLNGIEGLIEDLEGGENIKASETRKLFDEYISASPEVGSRSQRTEESLLITMGALLPKLRVAGAKAPVQSNTPQP